MTQNQKGLLGAGVMAVLSAGIVLSAGPVYQGIRQAMIGNVSYAEGEYVGTAKGFGGDVIAKVTISGGSISAVELFGPNETPDFGGEALKILPQAFVESGSSMVDAVSGSTVSSQAAKDAVQQALDQASGKMEVMDGAAILAALEQPQEEEMEIGDYFYDGGLRTGLGLVHSLNGSKDAGEENGSAVVDTLAAAVVIDGEGRVLDCKIDMVQANMAFDSQGRVVMTDSFATKKEIGDAYGMKAYSGIGKEWYEQAEAFEEYAVGRTAKEIAGIAVDDNGKPADADLVSGATIAIGDFQKGVIRAIQNAREAGASEGDTLGLAILTDMHKSADASAEKEGQCQAYSTYTAVTADAAGVITSCIIDSSQATVKFDTAGKITSDLGASVKSKRELGDGYGMKSASGIGKEWYEQADAMEAYITGKTADQVLGIAVDDNGKAADADLIASVTVSISDFQAAAAKAAADAQK